MPHSRGCANGYPACDSNLASTSGYPSRHTSDLGLDRHYTRGRADSDSDSDSRSDTAGRTCPRTGTAARNCPCTNPACRPRPRIIRTEYLEDGVEYTYDVGDPNESRSHRSRTSHNGSGSHTSRTASSSYTSHTATGSRTSQTASGPERLRITAGEHDADASFLSSLGSRLRGISLSGSTSGSRLAPTSDSRASRSGTSGGSRLAPSSDGRSRNDSGASRHGGSTSRRHGDSSRHGDTTRRPGDSRALVPREVSVIREEVVRRR